MSALSPLAEEPLRPADLEHAYRMHAHSVLRRAERLLGTRHDALEVVHEIFTSLLERPSQFRGESSLLTWLYAATTHACLNRLRDGATQRRILERNAGALEGSSRPCPPDASLELRSFLLHLPGELAAVAVYHYLDALTYDEMAVILGCSRRTVANLLDRLRGEATALDFK